MTVNDIAKTLDHAVLHPSQGMADLERECQIAVKYNVASICVKPYMVKAANHWLKNSSVKNSCTIGFPHGNSHTLVKVFETEQACKDGAQEIDMVINIGKALDGDYEYISQEIEQIQAICHKYGAILKVIFENAYIPTNETKIALCHICNKIGVAFVKTSTGFGLIKDNHGKLITLGAQIQDVTLMRKEAALPIMVKASGGIKTLANLLAMHRAGATRIGTSATEAIMNEALANLNNTDPG